MDFVTHAPKAFDRTIERYEGKIVVNSVLNFHDGLGARRFLSIISADAATPRSNLELLSHPLPFSQVLLLDAGDFVECKVMGKFFVCARGIA